MLATLVLLPLAAGLGAWPAAAKKFRRWLLISTAGLHAGLTGLVWLRPGLGLGWGWLGLDSLGKLFLSTTSLLFLAASAYAWKPLKRAESDAQNPGRESEAGRAVSCWLLFLAAMTLVTVSRHFGLLWVAVEATTLASAPLIYFHRDDRSLEAAWKYFLLCSVGIALALLGTFFLAAAGSRAAESGFVLTLDQVLAHAGRLHQPWLKAAFLLLLVGYGTKMGLAPMHSWLPDAHSEAPAWVSALLSGALLNCAFLGILRIHQVCLAAGLADFSQETLRVLGLVSMGVAAVFILRQADFKRLLAYSSVEHMGILSLGVGLGPLGGQAALLHGLAHSLIKGMMFLLAGNWLSAYLTKQTAEVRGGLRILPVTSVLWLAGFMGLAGVPPFGTFVSEFLILQAAVAAGHWVTAGVFLLLLAVIFVGLGASLLPMALGEPSARLPLPWREDWRAWLPPLVLGLLAVSLGLWIPEGLRRLFAGGLGA